MEDQGIVLNRLDLDPGDPANDYNFAAATSRITFRIPPLKSLRIEAAGEWVMFESTFNFIAILGGEILFDDSPPLPVVGTDEFIRTYPFRYLTLNNTAIITTWGPASILVGSGRGVLFGGLP